MIYDIKCKHCDRYLGSTQNSTKVTIKCSNSKCKKLETYKVVFMSEHMTGSHPNSCSIFTHPPVDSHKEQLAELKQKLSEADGRTKEAKDLKSKIEDMEQYIAQLEGIIDGQG